MASLVPTAYRGWRGYDLAIKDGKVALMGAYGLLWTGPQATVEHDPPALGNSAGIYIAASPLIATEYGSILAEAIGWGKAVIHEAGARVEHARITRLHVPSAIARMRIGGEPFLYRLTEFAPVIEVGVKTSPKIYVTNSTVKIDTTLAPATHKDTLKLDIQEAEVHIVHFGTIEVNTFRARISGEFELSLVDSLLEKTDVQTAVVLRRSNVWRSTIRKLVYAAETRFLASTVAAYGYLGGTIDDGYLEDCKLKGFSETALSDVRMLNCKLSHEQAGEI